MLAAMALRDLLGGNEPTPEWLATPEAQQLLTSLPVRRGLYRAMLSATRFHPEAAKAFAPMVRALLPHEVAFRSQQESDPDDTDGCGFENLYKCALVLFDVGELVDVMPLFRAKHTNFDTGLGMDGEFLLGAGLHATRDHAAKLAAAGDQQAKELLDYLGLMDDNPADVNSWRTATYSYHLGE
jgi:hypothetical protein